jgi:hypothetical protein
MITGAVRGVQVDSYTKTSTNALLGNRNLIINGAMNVAQRSTSETGVTTEGYHACDRWKFDISSLGTWTISQDSDAPAGFANSLKLDCTTANASPAAGSYAFLNYRFEGQDLQLLKKGTSDATDITVGFWIKSNKTGNLQVNLNDVDNTRIIAQAISIESSATWEYKTVTFPGDTTGTLDNDTSNSLRLEFWLHAGTNWTSGSTPTSWESLVSSDRAAGTNLDLGDNTSNYLNITGVQLEVGNVATPFEHELYSVTLGKCQRYYQTQAYGDFSSADTGFMNAAGWTSGRAYGIYYYPGGAMRINPSITFNGTIKVLSNGSSGNTTANDVTGVSPVMAELRFTNTSVVSSGNAVWVRFNSGAKIEISAEL